MTTQALLTEWLETYQKEHIKKRTYSRYQGLIAIHIIPMFGEVDISALGHKEIQFFLSQQRKDGNIGNQNKFNMKGTNGASHRTMSGFRDYLETYSLFYHTNKLKWRFLPTQKANGRIFFSEDHLFA